MKFEGGLDRQIMLVIFHWLLANCPKPLDNQWIIEWLQLVIEWIPNIEYSTVIWLKLKLHLQNEFELIFTAEWQCWPILSLRERITVELFKTLTMHKLCDTYVNEVFQNVLILWMIYFTAQYKAWLDNAKVHFSWAVKSVLPHTNSSLIVNSQSYILIGLLTVKSLVPCV